MLARIRAAVAGAPEVEITRAYRGSPLTAPVPASVPTSVPSSAPASASGSVPVPASGSVPVPASGSVPVPVDRARAGDAEVVERFAERVADYRAVVHVVDEGEAAATIAAALARRGAARVVVPDGLPPEWAPADPVTDDPPLSAAELDEVDGVLTGCAVAIAETGTIVLDTGPGQGRRVLTLVPDYHLCVVRAGQIAAGVPEAVGRLDPSRPLTWISGPSATSDIELDRVEGVHGPRTLEVVVIR
ncbi:lactate utilization protein C [Streptosporangium sp. NPDC050855]|uniref:lactate utilization protein C n=1 Tax=Streptosporangium sp. NPDC050855 TaxID=3366194 RepID=UPI0037A17FC3